MILKNSKGNMIIWAPAILVVLLTFFLSVYEYSRLTSIAANTRDAVQAAMTQVCTDNSHNVYTGVREGYAGGYKLENTSWTSNVSSGEIVSKVDAKLGTTNGVKMSDGKMVYRISDISVDVQNAPLAPVGTDGVQQLTGTVTCTLTVPLSSGWSALPPMVTHPEVKASYSPQGSAAGSSNPGSGGQPVTSVSLSASDMTLDRGDTQVLSATLSPDDATDRRLSWTSSDTSVCTITQTGAVTGINNGTASVVALSDSGQMASCSVTVVSPVTGVTLDKTSVTMIKGATESLTATVRPSDATNQGVQWASSDSTVCTVDSSGKVTAVGTGTATVTVMTQEGGYFADCDVTVKIPVSGLTLDKTNIKIAKGAADTLKATVYPSDATKQDVLWASSDDSVCTVDQSGNIKAIGVGSAVISATTKDGNYTATCTINVYIPVTGISVNPSSLTLIKGKSGIVTATVSPADATDKTVIWKSDDSNIASVDSSGHVSANNVGTATITATTEDGGFTASCIVTVKPNTFNVTVISSTGGTTTGSGTYLAGTNVTLREYPNEHYHFVNWTDDYGDVIGADTTYTIFNLRADTTVYAHFQINYYDVSVSAGTGGYATGSGCYAYGSTAIVAAYPYDGYQFSGWSNGITSSSFSFTVTDNITLVASFKPIYDCKAQNFPVCGEGFSTSGGITADGSIDSTIFGARGSWMPIFDLMFDAPLSTDSSVTVHGIYINPNDNPPGECWLEVAGICPDGTYAMLGQKFIPPSAGDLVFTSSGKKYSKLYFYVTANSNRGFRVIAPVGCLTVNGHRIKNVELI